MPKELSFRRGREHRFTADSDGFIQKTNHSINRMSRLKFGIIVVLLLGAIISFFVFSPTSKFINDAINIPKIIDTNANCNDILNPSCWTDSFFPKLPETNNLTNALLIGMDTREAGNGSGLMNTDTIMLASYDHELKKVFLYSFPRDLYVPYEINGKGPYYNKINAIYATGEFRNDTDGMKLLKENIEDWFDIEIHYTAKVNFNTVEDIVNSLGEITVDVEKDYTDVYPYKELSPEYQKTCSRAVDLPAYCVFKYEKGEHTFNGEEALIYARMRQYSSDFDRARRQQQVVSAIKDKFVEGDMSLLEKAKFGWDTYTTITNEDNVESNLKYNDLLGGMRLMDEADLNPIQIVLDPSLGGGGYFIPDSIDGIYVVKLKGNSFDPVMKYIENLKKYPDIYQDKANILLANSSGLQTSQIFKITKEGIPFQHINYVVRTKSAESGVIIYVFNETKSKTVDFLKDYFKTDKVRYAPADWSITQSGYKEDILVVEGPATSTATPTPAQ